MDTSYKKGLLAVLAISLLFLSVAFLSEAIDSLGSVPDLDINLGQGSLEQNTTKLPENVEFTENCDVDNYLNDSEGSPDLSISGVPGTSYLRAIVFETFEQGKWTTPQLQMEPYTGEYLLSEVHTYTSREYRDVLITPLKEMTGYVPAVLNVEILDSTHSLTNNDELRVFYSSSTFTSSYELSFCTYHYDNDLMESAQTPLDPSNLQVPDKDVDWLREMAEEVTRNSSSTYSKILSLISFLKENYTYNLGFEPAPPGVNPIEWFLKASKEGVCTHFNSALVLLARSIEIPSRLAGGYHVDSQTEIQLVYPSQRHAFAEFHFEDLGWIIFDATPSGDCSTCESVEPEEEGEIDGEKPIQPIEEMFNETTITDCVNNCTKMSSEGGNPPDIPLFEIYGVTYSGYLRTMVGEYYDGLWEMAQSESNDYLGELLSYPISGTRTSSRFTISPIAEMGGYIPTVKYTSTLSLDSNIQFYPDQLIFFSSTFLQDSYTITSSYFDFTEETLRNAEPAIDERYLNVPEELQTILSELALKETSNAQTPYEKYEALENFLRSTYEYDVNYTRAPDGIDPVEWFLFHEKRGVCANFNSAFVLLARSIGLPARLVGGYAIDASSNWQVVNASQAHTYSEAPFNGLGWITFGATGSGDGPRGEAGDEFEIEPVDEVFNETECQDCVNNCTKMSPEGGMPPNTPLFEIYGVTGSGYLRTMVGEYYDGLWEMTEPASIEYIGELLPYQISGTRTSSSFTITPLTEMGGYIPTVKYTDTLSLDSHIQFYPDQLLFFSSKIFEDSYTVTSSYYVFTDEALRAAEPMNDERYLNVPEQLKSILRELAIKEASDADTPYEKYEALGSFLRSNYEYDVNYTRAPAGIDPVEWFLFHEKRGVCANFNSAFVLLARSIGLPARYVVGYSIQPNVETQTVTSIQAHGYAEFPFIDIGWVIFDATGPGWFPFEEEQEVPPLLETVTEITEQDELGVKGLDLGVMGSVVDENGDSVDGLRTLVYLKKTKDENGLLCGEGPVVDGWFNIKCNLPMNLTNGYYLVQAHTLENHKYNGSWSDPPLKVVTQSELTLEAPEKVITGRAFMIRGNLSEYISGLPISNQFCTIESVGETLISETDIYGFFNETWIFNEPGNISLRVDWFGAEFFLGSNASSMVRSVPLSITPFDIEPMIRQESVMITGRVHAEELSGDNEEVILTLDDEAIGTIKTDENGFFSYSHAIPKDQELGEVMIGYSLVDGSSYVSQTEYVYARTYLQFNAPSILELNKDYILKANLTDDLGLPIDFVNLTVVNQEENENSTLLTDKEGVIEVPLRLDDTPDYDSISYKVSFNGVGYYLETYNEVVVPINISPKQEEEVQHFDLNSLRTRALILGAVGLVGYVAYTYLKKRRKQKADELDDAEELEPLVDLSPGIYSLEGLLEVKFPQIATSFPMVWGVKEEFIVQLHPVGNLETYGGKLYVTIIVDGEEGPSITIFSDKIVDYPIVFNRKGSQHLKVVYKGQEHQGLACDIVFKVVEYREEVNDLFNDEFEAYRRMREEIKNHFTAREFMRSILEGKSERYYSPLNEMVSVFEMADYSLHEIRRSEYERYYRAKQEFGEIKVGN